MWNMIYGRRVRRTTLISIGSLALLVGISLTPTGLTVAAELPVVATLLLWLCLRRRLILAIPAVVAVGLMVGLWRGGVAWQQLAGYQHLVDHKVSITGTVIHDPTYGAKGQRDFYIDDVEIDDRHMPGQVRVTTFAAVEPKQGDKVVAAGKLKPGFGNYQAGVYFASVQVTQRDSSWLSALRHKFSAAILNVISEPQASLGLGFLLGIKSQLPDELNEQLKIVGLTHIVVASGYNLTILVRAARRLFARWSKYQSLLAALALMASFVAITGMSPSMSRAALVTTLSLAAWYYGRVIHPIVLLLFSAAVTAAINPLYVWGDIGWYLSFLAFGGVMLGGPLLQRRLYGGKQPPQLVQIGIETLCAELATLPLTLLIFGSISAVALVANMLVVPFTPLAMLASFVAGTSWLLLPGIGSWLALPAQWVLSYMTSVVAWLASIPWARQPMSLNIVGMILLYGMILALGLFMARRLRYNYLSKSVVE